MAETEFRDQEIVICAAILMPDFYVVRGHRHNDCFRTISGIRRYEGWQSSINDQGFVTSRNRFVTRQEGRKLQDAADIVSASDDGYHGDTLYSEDLY